MSRLLLLLLLSTATAAPAQHLTFRHTTRDTAFALHTLRFYLTDVRL